jgi:hypothetical protein
VKKNSRHKIASKRKTGSASTSLTISDSGEWRLRRERLGVPQPLNACVRRNKNGLISNSRS